MSILAEEADVATVNSTRTEPHHAADFFRSDEGKIVLKDAVMSVIDSLKPIIVQAVKDVVSAETAANQDIAYLKAPIVDKVCQFAMHLGVWSKAFPPKDSNTTASWIAEILSVIKEAPSVPLSTKAVIGDSREACLEMARDMLKRIPEIGGKIRTRMNEGRDKRWSRILQQYGDHLHPNRFDQMSQFLEGLKDTLITASERLFVPQDFKKWFEDTVVELEDIEQRDKFFEKVQAAYLRDGQKGKAGRKRPRNGDGGDVSE